MKILYINLILNIISRALNNCSIILMNNFGWVAPRGNFLNMIVYPWGRGYWQPKPFHERQPFQDTRAEDAKSNSLPSFLIIAMIIIGLLGYIWRLKLIVSFKTVSG